MLLKFRQELRTKIQVNSSNIKNDDKLYHNVCHWQEYKDSSFKISAGCGGMPVCKILHVRDANLYASLNQKRSQQTFWSVAISICYKLSHLLYLTENSQAFIKYYFPCYLCLPLRSTVNTLHFIFLSNYLYSILLYFIPHCYTQDYKYLLYVEQKHSKICFVK